MRRRKKDRHLPQCVYFKHGAYYYVKGGKWTNLGKDFNAALHEYAILTTHGKGISDIVDRAIKRAAKDVKPSTLTQYKRVITQIKEAFQNFAPSQVKRKHVSQFMHKHEDRPALANRMRTVLIKAFDYAIDSGQCEFNPAKQAKAFKTKKRERYLTDAEYNRIKAKSPKVLKIIMDLAFLTGQRINDVLSVKQSQVSRKGIYFQQEKTGKRLLVAMNPDLESVVKQARGLHGNMRSLYLISQRNGKKVGYQQVWEMFDEARDAAKVKDARLHDIRARAITAAKRQGLDPVALAGHTDPKQTEDYIRDMEAEVVQGPSFRRV